MLTVVVPEAGRVTVSGEPCTPQLSPPVNKPMNSTLIGEDSAAVVGSTTTMFIPLTTGTLVLKAITSTVTSNGTITNGTGFESAPGGLGFCTCTLIVPAAATCAGVNAIVQLSVVAQVVAWATPFSKINEAPLPLPATKFNPSTSNVNPSTDPAITLDGRITSISGPVFIVIVAVADFVESAWLVAVIEIAFGEGAAVGAVYSPFASTDPHAAPPQPCPATPLCTLHITAVLLVSVTDAKNCMVLSVPVEGATIANGGEISTATGPAVPVMAIIALPLFVASARLVAVSITGFDRGTAAGAR